MLEILEAFVHDDDTGKNLEPPIKLNLVFNNKAEVDKYRRELKRQKENGHKVEVYFKTKEINE